MIPPALRGVRPPNRVGRGIGKVTPIATMRLGGSGSLDVAQPGRDRFDASHPAVLARPSAFRPCDPGDASTRSELRELVSRSSSGPSRRPPQHAAGSYGLTPAVGRRPAHVASWAL